MLNELCKQHRFLWASLMFVFLQQTGDGKEQIAVFQTFSVLNENTTNFVRISLHTMNHTANRTTK